MRSVFFRFNHEKQKNRTLLRKKGEKWENLSYSINYQKVS